MTIELPVLRLGLAGFSSEEQAELAEIVRGVALGMVHWRFCDLDDADGWLVNGARVQDMGEGRIRIGPGVPTARSVQLHLPDTDRAMAFSKPCKMSLPSFSFEFGSPASIAAVLRRFEAWLSPIIAQFCLASHIVEHQSALRSGYFDLSRNDRTIAIVNMHGETAVLSNATPADFDEAVWRRLPQEAAIPDTFVRATMSHLMWQFGTRTQRDVLPPHYRSGALYFRRAPKVAQKLLNDSHLLLLRELAADAATFDALQRRTGFDERHLAHDLAALYFVGSITSNPKRAARPPIRQSDYEPLSTGPHSNLPSGLDSVPPDMERRADPDMTAPAPMGPM